jgi:predicted nucleic acid-binding protein
MTFSSCLTDQHSAVVLDASVIINLLATTKASEILQALGVPVFVTSNVVHEISQGTANARQEPKLLNELIDARVVQMVTLEASSLESFFSLVTGHTADSLGDGEAATLVHAHTNHFAAAIDEKKATRIANERFDEVVIVTTVDIFAYAPVLKLLGRNVLANAVLRALRSTRMQVRPHQFAWIMQLIGEDNLSECPSLKKHARRRAASC